MYQFGTTNQLLHNWIVNICTCIPLLLIPYCLKVSLQWCSQRWAWLLAMPLYKLKFISIYSSNLCNKNSLLCTWVCISEQAISNAFHSTHSVIRSPKCVVCAISFACSHRSHSIAPTHLHNTSFTILSWDHWYWISWSSAFIVVIHACDGFGHQ